MDLEYHWGHQIVLVHGSLTPDSITSIIWCKKKVQRIWVLGGSGDGSVRQAPNTFQLEVVLHPASEMALFGEERQNNELKVRGLKEWAVWPSKVQLIGTESKKLISFWIQ